MDQGNIFSAEGNVQKDSTLDCLLIHVPKFQTYYPAFNVYQSCNRMAMGLIALADLADKNDFHTRVVHLGVEKIRDKAFSFAEYLRKNQPRLLGFSLHFHHSLVDTLRYIEVARRVLPNSFIFIGGFTATFFAEELMNKYAGVDAVIKGDAEVPLLGLLERVCRAGNSRLSDIPNIVYREDGTVITNPQDHVVDEELLNELDFTNFSLLEHAETYVGIPTAFVRTNLSTGFDQWMNSKLSKSRRTVFWGLPVGRGCVAHCFYCGGGAKAQIMLNKRNRPIFRQPEKVIETIKSLKKIGYQGAYVSFDPHPWSSPYYVELFQLMQKEQLQFNILFSSWGLPSDEFLQEFAQAGGPDSAFLISPETGSEALRMELRKPSYSNEDFLAFLAHAEKLGIKTTSYFTIGLPGETMNEFQETVNLNKLIKKKYSLARTEAFLIEIEPAAPWYMNPERYGITLNRSSFEDFLADQTAPAYSSMTSLGYTSSFFGTAPVDEKEFSMKLDKLRRKYFDNPLKLTLLQLFWKTAQLAGVVPRPKKIQLLSSE